MNSLKTHRFYKEAGTWYIDLPSWPGPKSALAMVAGADTLLDKLSKDTEEVILSFSEEWFPEYWFVLRRDRVVGPLSGADYHVDTTEDDPFNIYQHNLWLCAVTLYVFNGKYPKTLYVQVHE